MATIISQETRSDGSVTTINSDGMIFNSLPPLKSNTTNSSQSEAATSAKYENAGVVNLGNSSTLPSNAQTVTPQSFLGSNNNKPNATPTAPTPAIPNFNGAVDQRVRLLVPKSYLVGQAMGPNGELANNGGIVFPYVPTIAIEHSANYDGVSVMHSNYTQYFYKNSNVGEIAIGARFTAQNETEACIFLAVNHLLRGLTKMIFGNDTNAGSPPPVCRLMGWGQYMLDNTPVAIRNYRLELPNEVDYITVGNRVQGYGVTSVPTICTVTISLVPIYSRNEMMNGRIFNNGWLTGNQRLGGYL